MKNSWYNWFVYAGIWVIAAFANYFTDREYKHYLFQIILFLLLAPCQLICEKHGEKGKKAFKYICICAIALCVLYLLAIIFETYNK